MAQDIYAQHGAAFSRVAAWAILHEGEHVANMTFKYPADGAGRLYAYVHWLGLEMVCGFAGGYGYDKASAAVAAAAGKMPLGLDAETGTRVDAKHVYNDFRRAAIADNGQRWTRQLELAGFTVLAVIA